MVELPWFWHQEQNVEQALWAQSNSPIMQSFGPGILLIGINWGCNINFYIGISIWPWYIGILYIHFSTSRTGSQCHEHWECRGQASKELHYKGRLLPVPRPVIMVLAGKIHHPNEMEVLVWHVTVPFSHADAACEDHSGWRAPEVGCAIWWAETPSVKNIAVLGPIETDGENMLKPLKPWTKKRHGFPRFFRDQFRDDKKGMVSVGGECWGLLMIEVDWWWLVIDWRSLLTIVVCFFGLFWVLNILGWFLMLVDIRVLTYNIYIWLCMMFVDVCWCLMSADVCGCHVEHWKNASFRKNRGRSGNCNASR